MRCVCVTVSVSVCVHFWAKRVSYTVYAYVFVVRFLNNASSLPVCLLIIKWGVFWGYIKKKIINQPGSPNWCRMSWVQSLIELNWVKPVTYTITTLTTYPGSIPVQSPYSSIWSHSPPLCYQVDNIINLAKHWKYGMRMGFNIKSMCPNGMCVAAQTDKKYYTNAYLKSHPMITRMHTH